MKLHDCVHVESQKAEIKVLSSVESWCTVTLLCSVLEDCVRWHSSVYFIEGGLMRWTHHRSFGPCCPFFWSRALRVLLRSVATPWNASWALQSLMSSWLVFTRSWSLVVTTFSPITQIPTGEPGGEEQPGSWPAPAVSELSLPPALCWEPMARSHGASLSMLNSCAFHIRVWVFEEYLGSSFLVNS